MQTTRIVILTLSSAASLFAGKFNCGMVGSSSEQVTLQIPRPPDAYPQIKAIKVEILEADRNFHDQARLKAQIEQALSKDFNVDKPKADARLRVTVVTYDVPAVTTHVQNENRAVTVNNKVQTQTVPVTYWTGAGRISLRVQMVDSEDMPLDSFNPEEIYKHTREVVVKPVQQSKSIFSVVEVPSIHFPSRKQVPAAEKDKAAAPATENTPAEINAAMLDSIVGKIQRRYVRSFDSATFKLACDDSLRAGNRMAMGSSADWEKANSLWAAAEGGKNEGDKDYNLAVAQEALAYKAFNSTLNPAYALPFFEKSLELYEKAQKLDPAEKYISASAERLRTARANMARAVEQRKLWEAERDKARDSFLAKREGAKAISTKRDDSAKESGYRQLVRASLAVDPKKDMAPMRNTGEKLGLTELEVERVVTQEVERTKGLTQYEMLFKQMIGDGVLSKEERQGLNAYYPTLSLSSADVKLIESKHKFTEEGVEAAPLQTASAPPTSPSASAPEAVHKPSPRPKVKK